VVHVRRVSSLHRIPRCTVHLTGLRRTFATTRPRGAAPLIRGHMAPLRLSPPAVACPPAPSSVLHRKPYRIRFSPTAARFECLEVRFQQHNAGWRRSSKVEPRYPSRLALLRSTTTLWNDAHALCTVPLYSATTLSVAAAPFRTLCGLATLISDRSTLLHGHWSVCTALPQCDTTLVGCGLPTLSHITTLCYDSCSPVPR
jgi:hypothetical protein